MPVERIANVDEIRAARIRPDAVYTEVLRRESMSVGIYVIPAGVPDEQAPHNEDEVYLVVKGRGRFRRGPSSTLVATGDLLYVRARDPHRFEEVTEELVLAVFFAPPEGTAAPNRAQIQP